MVVEKNDPITERFFDNHYKSIMPGNQTVIECRFLKDYFIDLTGCEFNRVRLDLSDELQISTCFFKFI